MKTTVKIKPRKLKGTHEQVLVLHVIRHRETRTLTLPYRLSSREWNKENECVFISGRIAEKRRKELQIIQRKLLKDKRFLSSVIKQLEASGEFSSQEVIIRFREKDSSQSISLFIRKKVVFLQSIGKYGTARSYDSALKSFLLFRNNQDLKMDYLDAGILMRYECYLRRRGNSMNTISCYMRSLRAVYNDAIREQVIRGKTLNPFAAVFTGNAPTRKRAIQKEAICRIDDLNVVDKKLSLSKDLFLFSFFAQGMSFIDIISLKKDDIRDGVIFYSRHKTGQLLQVEIQPCMKQIINRYQEETKESVYLFPVLKDNEDPEKCWMRSCSCLSLHNRHLKEIAVMAGINTRLTSYVARHSWATIASLEGIPLSTISRGMGHETEKTTEIYIARLDYSDVNRANRRILSVFNRQLPVKIAL